MAQRVLQCSASATEDKLIRNIVYGERLSAQTYLYSYLPVLMTSYFDVLEFQHSFFVSCVADVPRSSERPLQGNQASV